MILMTIDKINIVDFGVLSDITIEFSKRLNVIYAPNESGKTTLLSFIKFVFYGTKQKKQKGEAGFKEKYMPWNGKPMCGSIELTCSGNKYIVSRYDNGSNTKKTEIRNLMTGEIIDYSDEPGRYFFSVGEKAFSDSCFVNDAVNVSNVDGDLLSVLSEGSTDSASYKKVRSVIEEKIARISSPKRSGSKLSIINAQKQKAEEKLLELRKKSQISEATIAELESKLSKLDSILCESDGQIRDMQKRHSDMSIQKLMREKVSEEKNLDDFTKRLNDANHTLKQNEEYCTTGYKKTKRHTAYVIALAVILFFVAVAFAVSDMLMWAGIIFAAALVVLACRIIISGSHQKTFNKITAESESLRDFISLLTDNIKASEARISGICDEICAIQYEVCDTDVGIWNNINITNYFTNREFDDIMYKREESVKEYEVCKSRLLSEKLQFKEISEEIEKVISDIRSLQQMESDLNEKINLLNTELMILDSAFATMKDSFLPALSQKAFEIMNNTSPQSYEGLLSDENFNASVRAGYEYKNSAYFSKGTRDLIYISLRLAMCDFLSHSVAVPVFFDDVLAFFDDRRCNNILNIFYEISSRRQLFLCTCRGREADYYADFKDVSVIGPEKG